MKKELGNLFHPHDLSILHGRLCVSLGNTHTKAKRWSQHRFVERLEKEFADPHQWSDRSERDVLGALIKNNNVRNELMASKGWLNACDLVTAMVFITLIHHRKINILHLQEWMRSSPSHVQICSDIHRIANWLENPYRIELQSLADRIGSDWRAVPFLFINEWEIGKRGGASKQVGAFHGYAVRCLAEHIDDNVGVIVNILKACGVSTSSKRVQSAIENRRRFRTKP